MRCLVVLLTILLLISACSVDQVVPTTPPAPDNENDTPTVVTAQSVPTGEPTPEPSLFVTSSPSGPTATPVPIVPMTLTPFCATAPQNRMIIQERGRVTIVQGDDDSLNMRSGPGISYRQIRQLAPGAVFFVLDGPICDGGYAWYRILYRGQDGWVAEGDDQQYFIEPYLPG